MGSAVARPDDIILWPDGDWCFRRELPEMVHKSDDYEVVSAGSLKHEALTSTLLREEVNNGRMDNCIHGERQARTETNREKVMSYEFQATLFNTPSQMCDAIAVEWISAGGLNSREDITNALRDYTDDQLAAECVEGWGLSQKVGDEGKTWMEVRDIDLNDIKAGFARVRTNPAQVFGWEDEE